MMNNKLKIVRSGAIDQYENPELPFSICWSITGRCPYQCSYCYEKDKQKRSIEPSIDDLLDAIPRIKNFIRPIKKEIHFMLFGGEPTAHKHFLKFVSELKNNFPNAKLSFLSNAYRPVSFFKSLNNIDPDFIYNFSAHFENLKDDIFFEKIAFLSDAKANIAISLQFLARERERIKEFAEKIRINFPRVKLFVQFLRTKESGFKKLASDYTVDDHIWAMNIANYSSKNYFIDYIDECEKIYRRQFTFDEAFLPELSNFKGAHCVWPMQRITINENGNVTTGFCLPKPSFNIFAKHHHEISLNIMQPAICTHDFCSCLGMRDAAKFYDAKFAPQYLGGHTNLSANNISYLPLPDDNLSS